MVESEDRGVERHGLLTPLRRLLDLPNDSIEKTVLITFVVCLVCSLFVSVAAVLLRPIQTANEEADQRRQIAGILEGRNPATLGDTGINLEDLELRTVELATGAYVETVDPAEFDAIEAAQDPAQAVAIPPDLDLAQIRSRARFAVVYLSIHEGRTNLVVLPVYGRGFASTLYGYIGLSGDTQTVVGLAFYEHGETPGVGALIDDPTWRRSWAGKRVWDADGSVGLGVANGPVVPGSHEAVFQVDGLTGATWTGRGVTNLLHYWLGDHGFGPYLKRLRSEAR